MSKESLIYNRLNSVATYHPSSAETYLDWSTEAGDIVKISQDGTEYNVPIMNSTMTWKGSPVTAIDSSGNKKRDAVAKMAKRKYGGSGGTRMAQEQHLFQEIDEIGGSFEQYITGDDGLIHTTMWQNKDNLGAFANHLDANGKVVYSSGLFVNEQGSSIGFYKDGSLTSGVLIGMLNDGTTSVKIKADRIDIDGDTIVSMLRGETLGVDILNIQDHISIPSVESITVDETDNLADYIEDVAEASTNVSDISVSSDGKTLNIYLKDRESPLTFSKPSSDFSLSAEREVSGQTETDKFYVRAYRDGEAIDGKVLNFTMGKKTVSGTDYVYVANGATHVGRYAIPSSSHSITMSACEVTSSQPSDATPITSIPQALSNNKGVLKYYSFKMTCGSTTKKYYFKYTS